MCIITIDPDDVLFLYIPPYMVLYCQLLISDHRSWRCPGLDHFVYAAVAILSLKWVIYFYFYRNRSFPKDNCWYVTMDPVGVLLILYRPFRLGNCFYITKDLGNVCF